MAIITVGEDVSMLIVTSTDIFPDIRGIVLAVDYVGFTAEVLLSEPLIGENDKILAPIGSTVFFEGKDIVKYLHPVTWTSLDKEGNTVTHDLDTWFAYKAYLKNRENKLLPLHDIIGDIEPLATDDLPELSSMYDEIATLTPPADAIEEKPAKDRAPAIKGATKATTEEKTAAIQSLKSALHAKISELKPADKPPEVAMEKPKKTPASRSGKLTTKSKVK